MSRAGIGAESSGGRDRRLGAPTALRQAAGASVAGRRGRRGPAAPRGQRRTAGDGRGERIRTSGLTDPNRALYQAELRPDVIARAREVAEGYGAGRSRSRSPAPGSAGRRRHPRRSAPRSPGASTCAPRGSGVGRSRTLPDRSPARSSEPDRRNSSTTSIGIADLRYREPTGGPRRRPRSCSGPPPAAQRCRRRHPHRRGSRRRRCPHHCPRPRSPPPRRPG